MSPEEPKMDWDSITDRAADHVFIFELLKGMGMTLGEFKLSLASQMQTNCSYYGLLSRSYSSV